jgi:hypothetical protein
MYITWRIDRTPYRNGAWSSTNTVSLEGFYDPQLITESGEGRDSFALKLTNFANTLSNVIQPQDKLDIYRVANSDTATTTDLLMTGVVQAVPEEVGSNKNSIRVEGYNFSEAVMSALVFYDATNDDVAEAIQGALNSVRVFNSRLGVTWSSGNPSVKTGGGAFPTVGEKFFYKPLRYILEKYSTNTKTEDGTYYWYVNKDNELVWRPATNTTSYSFNNTTDTDYRSMKVTRDLKDVKNYIIIKGGVDPEGKAIQTRVQDYASMNKNGMKFYILTDTAKTSGTLITADTNSAGVTHMRSATYPFTTTWKSLVTGDYVTAASYDDYLEALRLHVVESCRIEGQKVIEGTRNGRLKLEIVYPPETVSWGLGDNIATTVSSFGTTMKRLRVIGAQYNTDSDTFTLEEDYGAGSL